MKFDKLFTIFSKLKALSKKVQKKKRKERFRKVTIGIRFRMLGVFLIFTSFVIIILSVSMYLHQRRLFWGEKIDKVDTLTRIISGPSQIYLDRTKSMSQEELSLRYEVISKEALNFKNYNSDIRKIFVLDRDLRIVYSTYPKEVGRKVEFIDFFNKVFKEKEERVFYYDYDTKKDDTKNKYRLVTYPIFLKSGEVIEVLKDFKKYYPEYEKATSKRKGEIVRFLTSKYRDFLNFSFEGLSKVDKNKSKPNISTTSKSKVSKDKDKNITQEKKTQQSYPDIEFLFVELFSRVLNERGWRLKKTENWMISKKWLEDLKEKQRVALENKRYVEVGNLQKDIISNLNVLYNKLDDLRLLGAVSIVFDMDKIWKDIDSNFYSSVVISGIVFSIGIAILFFLVNFLVKNIKILEKWALEVSEGNLDTKVDIQSSDEIGRLSDVFMYMIDEIKKKYHLEKFVSKSTREILERKDINFVPGQLGKEELVFLFSDVRGFTSFAEKNPPEIVIDTLNIYYDLQAKIIHSKGGDIDDYVGDQIMCHFKGSKKADTAISVAIEIIKKVKELNEKRKKEGLPYFEIGIGIHGGEVVVGNIGVESRMDFACIGDPVNLASRLCSLAGPCEILVSKETYQKSSKKYNIQETEPVSVKGKEKKVEVVKILV